MTSPNKKSVIYCAGMVNIKLDLPVKCYYSDIEEDSTSVPHKYYQTFLLNNCVYTIYDYAVVNDGDSKDIAVVQLLCIFATRKKNINIVVRKYVFAKFLKQKLIANGCTKFDENEVVEDSRKDYILSAKQIIRKCDMLYGQEEENCIISENNLDPLTYFSCRFKLTTNGLSPILKIPESILREYHVNNQVKQPSNQRKKSRINDISTTILISSSGDENTPEKMKSPKDTLKNTRKISVKMSPQVGAYSPVQRNSVKRNLNKSFGDSPGKNSNSILNYSIITDEEDDNSLVLKLKVSEKNKIPLVLLKKSNDDIYTTTLKQKETESEQSVRKSTRVKVRKSYADYISPVKSTPRKRTVSKNDSIPSSREGTPVKSSRKNSQARVTEDSPQTPAKVSLNSVDVVSGKRSIRTPKRYNDEIESPNVRSARRFLRLTSTEETNKINSSNNKRETRASKRRKNPSPNSSDRTYLSATPESRVNLNESIRRTILKVALQNLESEMREVDGGVNSERKVRSTKQFFYESSSDDESVGESTPTKVKRRLPLRTSRTRSKSISSIESEPAFKTPNTRRALKNIYYGEDDFSPLKESPKIGKTGDSPSVKKSTSKTKPMTNTPKTKRGARTSSDDDSPAKSPKTPRTRRRAVSLLPIANTPKTPRGGPRSAVKQASKTPKNPAKLIREGVITPSMHSRTKAVAKDSTPLMKARSQLHVSYVPASLPCREKEYCDLFNFLEGKLLDKCGGCMYVSGVPGTGKTATVTTVVNHLLENEDVPKFSYVSVNGMRLTEPRQSYVEILKQLTGKTVPWEQAQGMLEERFTKSKKLAPVIMVIDELDVLCTKRQDVVYNLLDWPSKAKNQLIVVTIANTMDLPERLLMSRVTSRLGLTRLTFQAYTHKQLQEIVTKRLAGTDSFNPDAIQFVARKVASVSGDARRALDICRRAAEIAEAEGKGQLVNMSHVNEALNAMLTQPKVRAIKNCSRLEQLILQSIVAEVDRTGVEETTFGDVYKMLVSCVAIDGFRMVSGTIALSAVSRLSACRLLLCDQKCNDINQRIVLNVSVDDVYYALRKE